MTVVVVVVVGGVEDDDEFPDGTGSTTVLSVSPVKCSLLPHQNKTFNTGAPSLFPG